MCYLSKNGYYYESRKDADGNIYEDGDKLTAGTLRVTPAYKPNNYTISFDANGGTGTMDDLGTDYDRIKNGTAKLLENNYTKDGYVFAGWNNKEDGTGDYTFDDQAILDLDSFKKINTKWTTNNTSVTLYAQWILKTEVTVSFDKATAGDIAAQTITKGDKAQQPGAPVKTGYTFAGWYTDAAFTTAFDFTKPVNESVTLYAKFTPAKDTPCTVLHRMQKTDGTYSDDEAIKETLKGETDLAVTPELKTIEHFTAPRKENNPDDKCRRHNGYKIRLRKG